LLENVLNIFVKYPEPGFVKTRLAKDIGKDEAVSLYRLFVEAILARTENISFRRIIFCYPSEKRQEIMDWLMPKIPLEFYSQKGDTLGERLSNAFAHSFKKGARRVITIGTDSPTIDKKVILEAFKELETKQCVIGPALDGGYYLIGLSSFHKEIFMDIDWSTSSVLKQTQDRLNRLELEFTLLDREIDVDSFKDLLVLKDKLQDVSNINPIGLMPLINALTNIKKTNS